MSKVAETGEQQERFQGNLTPEHLKEGPVQKRGCTDVICLILFIATWAGMLFIAIYSFSNGDPDAFIAPHDQFGNPCGIGNQSGYPYVYFAKQGSTVSPNLTICVSECPDNSTTQLDCAPDFNQSGQNCALQAIYETTTFGNRICLPTNDNYASALATAGAFDLESMFKAASDLQSGWWLICCVGLIGVLIGFMYVLFLKYCSNVVTWGILVLYILGLCIFGGICLLESSQNTFSNDVGTTALSSISPVVLKTIAAICFLIAFISLIVMCIFRDKIQLGVTVLKAAAEFVEDTKTILLLPPIFFVLSMIFYIFWVFTFIYLIGINFETETQQQGDLPFAEAEWTSQASGMFAFMIFGLVWNHAFFHALPQFVISSATCIWYFKDAQAVKHPVATSLFRALLHLGSIAFGALMIGILDFLRLFIKLFNKIFVPAKESQSSCAKFCGACLRGCVSCFEMCLQFIDRHAYVQMAMTGEGFCAATKEAFYLIMRNSVRFGVIHGLGAIFVFMGQIFITVAATLIGYLVLLNATYFQERLFSPVIMTLFFFLVSLIVGHSFMSIYGVSADAIIHCYAMDDELHPGGARHAPEYLKKIVNQSNKQKLLGDVRGKV